MKRLLFQIKSCTFSRKDDIIVQTLIRLEKKALKDAEGIRKIGYQKYLEKKQKGLLTQEEIELQYKNLEDVIFDRVQINKQWRTKILKNLTEENFQNWKIDQQIKED